MTSAEDTIAKVEILTTEFGDRVQRVWHDCGCMYESDLDENDQKTGTGCSSHCTTCFYGTYYNHNI